MDNIQISKPKKLNIKTLWMIWILATIIVAVAAAIQFYSIPYSQKMLDIVDKYSATNEGAFKSLSDTDNVTKYIAYIVPACSLLFALAGNFMFYKAYKGGELPSTKIFIFLTVLSLLSLGIQIYAVISPTWKDHIKDGTIVIKETQKTAREMFDELSNAWVDYATLGLAVFKALATIGTTIGIYKLKPDWNNGTFKA